MASREVGGREVGHAGTENLIALTLEFIDSDPARGTGDLDAATKELLGAGEVQPEFELRDPPKVAKADYALTDSNSMSREPQRASDSRGYTSASRSPLPSSREYPTLEAIQRLYRLFGYTTALMVFPYLLYRLVAILMRGEGDIVVRLMNFSWFAVPWVLGSVALTGTLFAAAEGIRLAIDIQANTLEIARSAGRRR